MMRVLHVLDHSLPYLSGYSFRSSYLINMQRRLGLQPLVVTSPKHEDFTEPREKLNEVDYYRLKWPSFYFLPAPRVIPLLKQAACLAALRKQITRLARELKVDLIHAHSPSLNALAASGAAQRLGLPWIYELRYYEEDAAVDRGKTKYQSLRYRLAQRLEQEALKRADLVVTIASQLRADLIARGIPAEKIFEVPNGVDTQFFKPRPPDPELMARHHLAGKTVVGFIGSFYAYEGLACLVEAMLFLLRDRDDLKLLLVGEGEMESQLREQIPKHLSSHFVFTGKIKHEQVLHYYSVMDMLVYPRLSSRLTEMTTPLKPLEAMAMERAVIGSDVGGLREQVVHNETGLLFEANNTTALAACISRLASNPAERRIFGQRGREMVVRTRDWERITERYLEIYGRLGVRQRVAA
jgi:PEP-CTERM/exosortase A-associated glycosyltransferase